MQFKIERFKLDGNVLTWEPWRFYSPNGKEIEAEGDVERKFFPVEKLEYQFSRDPEVNVDFFICVRQGEVEAHFIYEGEKMQMLTFDDTGDVVCYGRIPAGTGGITVNVREVV